MTRDIPLDEVFTWEEDFLDKAQQAFGSLVADASPLTYGDLKSRCDKIDREIDPFFEHVRSLAAPFDPGLRIHMVKPGEVPDGMLRACQCGKDKSDGNVERINPMEMFRVLYGSWPEWEGKLDSGQIVFIRIRHGQVWIGKAETGEAASESATLVKESMRDYFGVTDVIEALEELRQQGYYFVPPTSMEKGAKLYAGSPGGHNVKELPK